MGGLFVPAVGFDVTARDWIVEIAMRAMLNTAMASGAIIGGRIVELATDECGATSTGETYVAPGSVGYYHNPGGFSLIAQGDGTAIGNATNGGGLAAAFDGNLAQGYPSGGCIHDFNATATVGKSWGVPKTVTKFRACAPNNYDDFRCGGGSCSVKLQGSDDGVAWTDLYSGVTGQPGAGAWLTVDAGITATTAYLYHRLEFGTAGGGSFVTAEVEFYETAAPADMTIIPATAATLAAAPDFAECVFLYKDDSGSAVLGGDVTADLSGDNGAHWDAATLETLVAYDATYSLVKARARIATSSGTAILPRLQAVNGKVQRIGPMYFGGAV